MKNISRIENLFFYLIVFVLLSFHSSFFFRYIFIKHLSEGILLLMLGSEEETVFHICIAVVQHKYLLCGKKKSKEGDHEIVKCAHLHSTPETYRN